MLIQFQSGVNALLRMITDYILLMTSFAPDQKVRKPKRAQGHRFEEIGDAAKKLGEQGTAPSDFVVAGIDLGVREDLAVEVGKERANVAGAVGADVRGESVTEEIGKPADEGDVAEDVTAAKIRAVRFERIEAVWRKDDDAAAAFHDAMRFTNCCHVIGDMLDDFVEQDGVEGVVRER